MASLTPDKRVKCYQKKNKEKVREQEALRKKLDESIEMKVSKSWDESIQSREE